MIHLMIAHLFGLMTPGPGVAFWATAAMLGLAIVLKTTPMLQGVVMVAGGSYLMYLGFLMLKSRSNAVFESVSDEELNSSTTILKEIFKGLLVNLSNAKAIIYFASVMSYVLVTLTEFQQMLLAFLIIVIETFLYFYAVSVLFSLPFAKNFYSRYSRYLDNSAGVIFLLFGGFLSYSGVSELLG